MTSAFSTHLFSLIPLLTALCLSPLSAASPHPKGELRVLTDPGDLPRLKATLAGEEVPFPLQHTHATVQISGDTAHVEITQTYRNHFKEPVEGVYVFPLPENSAVDGMKIVIGERVIESRIQERKVARQTYQEARARGHTAALLEEERPNIFTQSVANIPPGQGVNVVIHYLQPLTFDNGRYEFVFPMVVGPRFLPGAPGDRAAAPDASRISPPYLGKGARNGHDISMDVSVNAGLPLRSWSVPTHDVDEADSPRGTLRLSLSSHDRLQNRDFVLHYSVATTRAQGALLSHQDGDSPGYFSLQLHPPRLDVDNLVGARELLFVVDVSGSMLGTPLSMCQDAIKEALSRMRPVDTFNLYAFAGHTGRAFDAPRPANAANIALALRYLQALRAGGGTYMADAVKAALSPEPDATGEGRHRYVFFLTDGYVGNEEAIFASAARLVQERAQRGQRAKVFGLGVGSSVNRHLLEGLSQAGDGVTMYAGPRQDPREAVERFFHAIDHPVLEDVEIDWGALEVEEMVPAEVPDLFATRPVVLRGRYTSPGEDTIIVRGTLQGTPVQFSIPVTLSSASHHPGLATQWARSKISELSRGLWSHAPGTSVEEVEESITALGLEFSLVTRHTSLVAVDTHTTVDSPGTRTLRQPVYLPEGVPASMAFAPLRKSGAPRILMTALRQAPLRPTLTHKVSPETEEESAPKERVTAPVAPPLLKRLQGQLQALRKSAACPCLAGMQSSSLPRDLEVRFFVSAEGKLLHIKVPATHPLSPTRARALERCLRRWVKGWTLTLSGHSPTLPIVVPLRWFFP